MIRQNLLKIKYLGWENISLKFFLKMIKILFSIKRNLLKMPFILVEKRYVIQSYFLFTLMIQRTPIQKLDKNKYLLSTKLFQRLSGSLAFKGLKLNTCKVNCSNSNSKKDKEFFSQGNPLIIFISFKKAKSELILFLKQIIFQNGQLKINKINGILIGIRLFEHFILFSLLLFSAILIFYLTRDQEKLELQLCLQKLSF